jgi:Ca2+-transporting ATPase
VRIVQNLDDMAKVASSKPSQEPWHSWTGENCLKHFGVDAEAGLTSAKVGQQREKFGPNKLDEQEKKGLFQLVMEQFEDTLVRILLVSAAVSFALAYFDEASAHEGLTAYVEPIVILTILILNAIVGVWQESSAEAALDALKKLAPDSAFALRDGHWAKIDAEDLVPGDIVEVRVGDKVPADVRVVKLKTTTLRIEQSQLTGESQSVCKEIEPVADKDCVIQGKTNCLFASTTVSNGACVGIVTATGMDTEIGVIQSAVKEAAEDEEQTPLQQKLDEFGNTLAKMIMIICILVWLINYKHFSDPKHGSMLRGCIYYFKIAVALAVAAIPEGLPTVITMCLALGTRQMAKRHAIVRKLPSVETLGCTTVICSDKTGTLTTNEMCVVKLAVPEAGVSLKSYVVEGHTYTPVGAVKGLESVDWKAQKALATLCKSGVLCNESRLLVNDEGRITRNGEPTEAAIRVLVEKLGCPDATLNTRCLQKESRAKEDAMVFSDYWAKGLTKRAVLEFNRDRKSMSVMYHDPEQGGNVLYVKGAPEMVLKRCSKIMLPDGTTETLTDAWRKKVEDMITSMAGEALRTIALAYRPDLKSMDMHDYDGPSHKGHKVLSEPANFIKLEEDMTFLGMTGILDPPRPECKPAIENCRVAGITVIMITGDNKITAEAISQNLGILKGGDHHENSFTGKEFEDLSDDRKVEVLKGIMAKNASEGAVFSRTEPRHKQMIVKILRSLGEITAMTGDGVNDAPALKQADIGIAMGIAGTEVAKEASDMVLQDDNFASIVFAVEEGRSIYNNMKAFIRYMISSNVGEVASIFFTAAMGIPEGLTPVQLLWVNLVTDGPPATALGFNPPDLDVMTRAPRKKDDTLISNWSLVRYMVVGLYVGFAVVGIFVYWFCFDIQSPDGHTLVTVDQLMHWGDCASWKGFSPKPALGMTFSADPCSYFAAGKVKASTMSLTVLVVIEMLNAFNALSEDGSLVQMPPWVNPWLIMAAGFSIGVHMIILYIPSLADIFATCPLDTHDWMLVMAFSSPVILMDEVLKFFGRQYQAALRSAKNKDQ